MNCGLHYLLHRALTELWTGKFVHLLYCCHRVLCEKCVYNNLRTCVSLLLGILVQFTISKAANELILKGHDTVVCCVLAVYTERNGKICVYKRVASTVGVVGSL